MRKSRGFAAVLTPLSRKDSAPKWLDVNLTQLLSNSKLDKFKCVFWYEIILKSKNLKSVRFVQGVPRLGTRIAGIGSDRLKMNGKKI